MPPPSNRPGCSTLASIAWRRAGVGDHHQHVVAGRRQPRDGGHLDAAGRARPAARRPAGGRVRMRRRRRLLGRQRPHRPDHHLRRDGAVPLVSLQPEGDVVAAGAAQAPAQPPSPKPTARQRKPPSSTPRRRCLFSLIVSTLASDTAGRQQRDAGVAQPDTARAGPARRPARATAPTAPPRRRCGRPFAGRRRQAPPAACSASSSAKRSMRAGSIERPAAARWPPYFSSSPAHADRPACRS